MKFISKIKNLKLKVSFGQLPIAAVILTSLLIFVLSAQFTYALWNPLAKVSDTIAGFRELFSIGGMIGIAFRVLTVLVDTILGQLVSFAGWIFDWSLSLVANANTSIIVTGWGVSLNFANNLFILILLGIAIGTILELPTFNYKTMLPKFLMVALLINFSLAIGNVIIGTTNMIAKNFSKSITSEVIANRFAITKPMQLTEEKFKADVEKSEAELKSPIKIFVSNFFVLVYKIFQYLLIIFVFLAGSVYMIARTFHLWLLLMLAPLAWISLLIPGLQQHWKSWWSKFIKWSIFAPAYLFFLYIGVGIMAREGNISTFNSFVSGHTTYGTLAAGIAGYIIQMLVVAFIMTAGLVISSQLGVGGSNFVLNYGKNLKGAASKRFKELRSKGPLSAEKLGAKFGGMGAGLLAKSRIGAVAGYGRETREKLRQEKLEKQQKKELLYESKQKLKEFREGKGERKQQLQELKNEKAEMETSLMDLQLKDPASLTPAEQSVMAFLPGELKRINQEIKSSIQKERTDELSFLRGIRTAAGSEKVDFEKELKKLLEKAGGGVPPAPAAPAGTTTL